MSKHDKFRAYWESLGKPQAEYRYGDDDDFNTTLGDPAWEEDADYRIAGDPHWELRKEWVDSDFTLPIEYLFNGAWRTTPNQPKWLANLKYRKAGGVWSVADEGGNMWTTEPLNIPGMDELCAKVAKKYAEAIDVRDEYGVNHPLYPVFMDAIEQATGGKGVRHGGAATPFLEQPWYRIARHTGIGGPLFQFIKKAEEACDKDDMETFERELLGSLVYGAMALIYARKHGYTKPEKV